ncbi:hypothetical protein OEZ85_008799 [Tetradesmus obliquus]|uniref:Anaphase-promoting complex subunit 4 WD40 domain-containing protein n=1 Tax=Tetradesmus obliquus TaxID=3088 RepID=A0ABY8TPJ3_TETOB|nr:hypothetical protein OEZ85_008799 [Tetradesmus obliquus]
MDRRSMQGALLMRELAGPCTRRSVECCAEGMLLQHALSHYCPLAAGAKSTIAAAYISGVDQRDLLATSHGDHTIKLHSWPEGKPVKTLQENGHTRTPWTVSWSAAQPGLLLTGALDGRLILWDVASGQPQQQVDTG